MKEQLFPKKNKTPKRTRCKFAIEEIQQRYSGYHCPHCKVYLCNGGPKDDVTRFRCYRCNNEIIIDGWDEVHFDDLMSGKF